MNYEDRNEDSKERPRLLQVFEAVARFGPISLDHVFPLVGRSRSATFRALKNLETSGWIRRTFNGRQYVATSVIDDLSEQGAISPPELDLICALLGGYQKRNRLGMQVGFYITPKTFYLLECSEKGALSDMVLCPGEETIACIAFSLLPASRQEKIFSDLNRTLDLISREELRARVRNYSLSLQARSYLHDPSGNVAFIGLKTPSGQTGALSVAPRSKLSGTCLAHHAEAICTILANNDLLAGSPKIRYKSCTRPGPA